MGCSGSRIGDDNFEKEYKSISKNSGELDQILNKLNFNVDQLNPKKISEFSKKKDLIAKYENDIDKSIKILNNYLSTNAIVIGAGKADKEARVLAINNQI
jgi:hypothetical protein